MTIQRNEKGQFLSGTPPPNPKGRPKRATEREYINIMKSACTPDRWRRICEKAIRDAIKGDGFARRFLADYLIGKPVQVLSLDVSDTRMLADLLKSIEERGVSASDLFAAMLAEVAMEESADYE